VNRGALRLRELCKEYGAAKRLAIRMGVDQSTVSHWINGGRVPSAKWRGWMQEHLGIAWNLWDQRVAEAA
jgi:transcriptional regulator with XRE-family HTH domain